MRYRKFWRGIKDNNNQVFLITHSPSFLEFINKPSNINKFYGNGIYKRINIKQFKISFPSFEKYYKSRIWKIIIKWLFYKKILIVEGTGDIYACLLNKNIKKLIKEKDIYIYNGSGAGEIKFYIKIIESCKIQDVKFFIDRDDATSSYQENDFLRKSKEEKLESYKNKEIWNKYNNLKKPNEYNIQEIMKKENNVWPFTKEYEDEIINWLNIF